MFRMSRHTQQECTGEIQDRQHNWQDCTSEIQDRYFRTGLGTYLWIACDWSNGLVSWGFNMLDIGMCHTIAGSSRVCLNEDGTYQVDGQPTARSRGDAWDAVFGGHFERLQSEISKDVGFSLILTPAPRL